MISVTGVCDDRGARDKRLMQDGRASGRVRADTFNVPLVIQLTDDEKFLWKDMKVVCPSLPYTILRVSTTLKASEYSRLP